MNMVSTMPYLVKITTSAMDLRNTAEFQNGSKYEDFVPATDKKSALGMAGLVAAGAGAVLAQKLGIFAVIALFLKKGIVLVIAFFGAAVAWLRRKFGVGQ